MNIMIDIVGSAVIACVILLLVFQMNQSMGSMTFQNTLDVITQENSKTIADIINFDFYKIGYGVSIDPLNPAIQLADSDRITFTSDIHQRGTVDTVRYFTSSVPYPIQGSTTKFKKLYRLVDTTASAGANLGITSFRFSYYDTLGHQIVLPPPTDTASLAKIKSIRIQMTVRNPISVDSTLAGTFDTTFAATYWEKWISPKNLRAVK